MAKKILSIVLSAILAFSAFAICSFAGDTITDQDRELYPAEELAIADPEERIDRALLSGRKFSYILASTAASEDILEYNLSGRMKLLMNIIVSKQKAILQQMQNGVLFIAR